MSWGEIWKRPFYPLLHLYTIRGRKSRFCSSLAEREFNNSKGTIVWWFYPCHTFHMIPVTVALLLWVSHLQAVLQQSIFKGFWLAIPPLCLMPLCQPFRSCSCPDGVWVSIFQGSFQWTVNYLSIGYVCKPWWAGWIQNEKRMFSFSTV